ncbi:chemotaxis protein CheB [Alteromonas antoniana]|uniref:chemotaxis protein CheB n=1 Tax=Alteromonas antoniana TaxID=2803813 RepID=UPI001C45EF19
MGGTDKKNAQLIVGVGASAGGLDALKRFFTHVPADAPIAFIVVQHLDPSHRSMLADILARDCQFRFCQAQDNQEIKGGNAYVIPPGKFIEVVDGKVKLVDQSDVNGTRQAVDHLFRSLADVYKRKSVGVLFSGTGSDGTAGLRALKAAGGLTLVQHPETADYPGMPESAIDAGVVDEILPVEDIPRLLLKYAAHPYHQTENQDKFTDTQDITQIRALLKAQEGFDLSQYKDSTVKRRLFRRMSLTGMTSSSAYLSGLRDSEKERRELIRDLLINVTDFFRDREAFEELDSKVIANIVDEVEEGRDVRVWVAGCATGEEAYTLAMLFLEQIEKSDKELGLRIFATDIDEEAIQTARRGIYSNSVISEIPEAFVDKYFTVNNDGYVQVNSRIRDVISFAQQNVYVDPPFSKLHLVSCRNLLIYLQQPAQKRVMKSFFYSLVPEGYLFLGSSESIGEQKDLFSPLSKKWRIYCRKQRDNVKNYPSVLPAFSSGKENRDKLQTKREVKQQSQDNWVQQTLLMAVRPSVIVDDQNGITYFHGNVNRFLRLPEEGQAALNLYSMLHPDIRTRMRSGIYKARKSGEKVTVNFPLPTKPENDHLNYRCIITPSSYGNREHGSVVISFEELLPELHETEISSDTLSHHDQDSMIESIERELRETKEELQNTIEELETSTEELKAAHEEALSTNEELQSSNEELEASTEELRSLNEELTTVNAQLKDKIDELSSTHDDIKNFFASTNLATIFLSSELKIKRYTPAAERLLRIGTQDIDKPIDAVCRALIDEDTLEEAKRVLDSLESSERQLKADDKWFIRKILPYQTESRKVDGVVITFIDVTALKATADRLKVSSEQHAVIAKLGLKALSTEDTANLIDQLVREVAHTLDVEYCKVLEYLPEEEQLLVKAGVGWDSGVVGKAKVAATNASQSGFALSTTEPVIVEDLMTEQRFSSSELLSDHKVVSGMSCIIEYNNSPYGVLSVHTKEKRTFNQEDVHFIMSAANILSVALHRKSMEKQLKANENRLRIAKDSANMGSFEWNIGDDKIYWDELLSKIWGFDSCIVTYNEFIQGVHKDDRESVNKNIAKAQDPEGDGHYHALYRVINARTGLTTWIEANGQIVFDADKSRKLIGMVVDVTEQRKIEASLKNAVKELQNANEKKNEFLATLGHEIRNPLASISAAVQIIEQDRSRIDWALGIMNSNVTLVSMLLDGLLDLTRISRGEVRLEKAITNVNVLLSDVVQNFTSSIQQAHQELLLELPENNILTRLDKLRVQQVINNVISNASKFTPDNGRIVVRLLSSKDTFSIQVEDSGIGLDMQFKDKVFEPFQQIKENTTRQNNGLGIGLSLVKQIAELHDGTVAIDSEGLGYGTTVTVTLPLSVDPNTTEKDIALPQPAIASSDLQALKKLRVMLVDDNETVSDGLSLILSLKGCEVAVYNTGQEALSRFREFSPNVALLDIGLPDMSGNDLVRLLKPELPENTLFLAITGYGHAEARRLTTEAGFDGHFNKPVQVNTIVNELLRFAEKV